MPRLDPHTGEGARRALETMLTIRTFEEALEDLFGRGKLHGTMHLSIGQEAVAVGTCGALADGDLITSTHRGHGHCIAHGADPTLMMAELLARETGYCRGRGGSMHIADVANGNLGANGIVAGSMTIAVGAARSQVHHDTGKIVACFFGDGAANEGAFHEALNLAGVWKAPVVFVCENNQYGMSMAVREATAGGSIAGRADAYGFPGDEVDGNDLVAVHEAVVGAAQRVRNGEGPALIEAVTYRHRGHSKSDRNLYRTDEEIQQWRSQRDPIAQFIAWAAAKGVLDDGAAEAARTAARERIRTAVREANAGPPPDVSSLEGAVYA
jgi:acetoin:2,6-dichlorophenolindophenol oxidoreductase subunit alpha